MDTVSNALCKIKNASLANLKQVEVRNSKIVKELVRILKEEGFIDDFIENDRNIEVTLGYVGKERRITRIDKVSNPGQRIYVRSKELKPVLNGRGIAIVSTSSGIMTGEGAKAKGLGGEFICKIW